MRLRTIPLSISVILAAGTLSGCVFQHRSIQSDLPVGEERDAFKAGQATVDDVLAAYGPPAELDAAGEGFSFRYHHVREKEFALLAFPLVVTRLGFFGGGGTEAVRIHIFDGDGVLRQTRSDAYPSGEGFGGLGGVVGTPQPPFWRILFHDGTEGMHGPPDVWGAALLRSSPARRDLPER